MNRCFTNVLLFLVWLTLFLHSCIVTWIIFIAATRTVHTCRTAPLHAILNFLISLFASYNPQSHKILQFCCFQVLPSKKVGGGSPPGPGPPGFAAPVSAPFTQDIYVTFYLLTGTYFNDVNGGRSILTNSQLKRILFMSSKKKKKKKWNKTEKEKKIMEKNNSNESETSVKMGYQI